MLKRKIAKTDYDALPDILKAEYKPNGDDYVLDTDDARELLNARDNEKKRADTLAGELATTKTKLKELETANGDFTSLKSSYETKIAGLEKQLGETNATLTNERRDRHVGAAADKIAARFKTKLIVPEIAKRLDVDPKDGKTVRVLDKDGKPSAATLADLEKEFVDNPEFKDIVVPTKASGSAVTGLPSGSALPQIPSNGKAPLLADMSPAEIVAYRQAQKEQRGDNT